MNIFRYVLKWGFISSLAGAVVGSASALFLVSLDLVTDFRFSHPWTIYLLPVAGLLLGFVYHSYGASSGKGNDLILEEFQNPKSVLPFRMAPLIYVSTLLTHLVGGSAGREGTAVQMGGAIVDQISRFFSLDEVERKILLIIGVSAGFASVFGTPFAGAIFALEVMVFQKFQYRYLFPSLLAGWIADRVCLQWGVVHTRFIRPDFSKLNMESWIYVLFCGIVCGAVAYLFIRSGRFTSSLFRKYIPHPVLRPFVGGLILLLIFLSADMQRFMGLGLETILSSFHTELPKFDFLLKIFFTVLTLSSGWKGGEVTPLFFIGATLGNAIFSFTPLSLSLVVALCLVGVFSAATKTPLACTVMGMELFGMEGFVFIFSICVVSYLVSGKISIYESQLPKIKIET